MFQDIERTEKIDGITYNLEKCEAERSHPQPNVDRFQVFYGRRPKGEVIYMVVRFTLSNGKKVWGKAISTGARQPRQ